MPQLAQVGVPAVSLSAACGWTLLRGVVVALLCVPLAWGVHRQLVTSSHRVRTMLWGLLLVPLITPALMTGYAYSSFSLSLIRHPVWNEVLYAALVALRFLIAAVLVVHLAPAPPVSASAMHVARLGRRTAQGGTGPPWQLWIHGPQRASFPAAAVMFLLVFQEFEIASLMNTTSWTVWLFDAQAGGLDLRRAVRLTLLPGLIQLLVLLPLAWFALPSLSLPPIASDRLPGRSRRRTALVWTVAVAGCVSVLGIPLLFIGRDAVKGIVPVLRNRQMVEEVVIAAGVGSGAGVTAMLLAALLLHWGVGGAGRPMCRGAWTAAAVFAVPGMLGSLSISLVVLWLFQQPAFRGLYDTLIPAIVALIVYLFPRALLLLLVFAAMTPQSSLHVVQQLKSSPVKWHRAAAGELRWRLAWQRHCLAAGLLCVWGYLELTPYSILAPPGMTAAPVRLYNLMHYGRSNVLSAMTLLTMLSPAAAFLVGSIVRRPFQRLLFLR